MLLDFFRNTGRSLCFISFVFAVSGCYQLPLEEIKPSHQYTAQQLMQQWRNHAARAPLPLVHNDDYYSPYTPPIRSSNSQIAVPANPAYYYDPRVDNNISTILYLLQTGANYIHLTLKSQV